MRRLYIFFAIMITAQFFYAGLAQQDRLAGRWVGKVQSLQGERDATVTFKKEGEGYTGTTSGLRGDEVPLKDVKVEGNKVTAVAVMETPQGSIAINYKFDLEGETLKGEGTIDFSGQTFTLTYNLKRGGEGTAAGASQPQTQQQRQQRPQVPQPQQKQSLDYFAGQWTFKYIGRESALAPVPREGTITFKKSADGKSLEAHTVAKSDSGTYQENAVITFDEATKMLTFVEKLGTGVTLESKGDWSTPISIRFTIQPVKVKGQTLQLRRMISVIAAHSFSVVEELSEDGGPFIRLGQALYTKVN
ncbi:MAG TPA: hypothetical protein VFQ92_23915 [Blastocatellia bacterium]|nr:hypothetical protein [Blastocatellia bacterium]